MKWSETGRHRLESKLRRYFVICDFACIDFRLDAGELRLSAEQIDAGTVQAYLFTVFWLQVVTSRIQRFC